MHPDTNVPYTSRMLLAWANACRTLFIASAVWPMLTGSIPLEWPDWTDNLSVRVCSATSSEELDNSRTCNIQYSLKPWWANEWRQYIYRRIRLGYLIYINTLMNRNSNRLGRPPTTFDSAFFLGSFLLSTSEIGVPVLDYKFRRIQ